MFSSRITALAGRASRTPFSLTATAVNRAAYGQIRAASVAAAPPSMGATNVATQPLSNPTLRNLEKRWETLPPPEQADIWMALRDRMKGSWHDMTLAEKKASYWIAFGAHGPRTPVNPPGSGKRIATGVAAGVLISVALFVLMGAFAKPPPSTMTREHQEASNRLLKKQKAEPFTGIGRDDYSGPGMIQSPPKEH